MKVLAINGSPRKGWNTATVLRNALDGAASQGAETELVHLYDLDFKGCRSCLACKLKNGKSYGKCAQQDGLTPVLEKIPDVDVLILGSPIYFGSLTGEMRSFIERAAFPYTPSGHQVPTLIPKKIKIGLILTLGADENRIKELVGIQQLFASTEMILGRTFGSAESLHVTGTYLYDDDYTKYACSHDVAAKAKQHREEVFPIDCKKVFDMGARLAKN
jgi:multimeric flavodoxin WrbA